MCQRARAGMLLPTASIVSILLITTTCCLTSHKTSPWSHMAAISNSLLFVLPVKAAAANSSSSTAKGDVLCIALSPPGTTPLDLPLPYRGRMVTGAMVRMDASGVKMYEGSDKDEIVVDFKGQGPIPFSLAQWRHARLAPRIGPRHPFSQTNLMRKGGKDGFYTTDPKNFSVQAWRPSVERGVMMAAVAQNGQKWNDGSPKFYGTVSVVAHSNAFGYSMMDGEYGNSDPNLEVVVGKVGSLKGADIDVAFAWFPYDQGWVGGYVAAPSSYASSRYSASPPATWHSPSSHSPSLPPNAEGVVRWVRGAVLQLPGVDPKTDGMLFVTSTDPGAKNDAVNVLGVYIRHRENGWRIQAREDSEWRATTMVAPEEFSFSFLYIPYAAGGLVGGLIGGGKGDVKKGAGPFRCKRIGQGQYEIEIEKRQLRESDGMVLLQVTGRDGSHHHFAQHAFLSFNFSSRGTILVESHQLLVETVEGSLQETFPFVDADFAFVWVDFRNPLTPTLRQFTGRLPHMLSSNSRFWVGILTSLGTILVATLVALGVLLYLHQVDPRHPSRLAQLSEEMQTDILRGVYIRQEGN